jgi:hypothetical protein
MDGYLKIPIYIDTSSLERRLERIETALLNLGQLGGISTHDQALLDGTLKTAAGLTAELQALDTIRT